MIVAAPLAGCHRGGRPVEVRASMAQDGLRVSGMGEAKGEPDVARATLGVDVRATTAAEATDQVGRAMQRVIDAVKAQGVAAQDLQTEQVSVYFEHEHMPYPPPPPPGPADKTEKAEPATPRGFYRATNTVRVTIRDLDKASAILGAATAAGANAVHGISFEIDDPARLLAEAREKAVRDAQRQAEQLAALTGVKLGRVVSVAAQPHGFFGPVRAQSAPMGMKEGADMPVERGEVMVQQQVEIVYELEPKGD
jgi:uncharacterized protein YggE